jgi:hypothetical protein
MPALAPPPQEYAAEIRPQDYFEHASRGNGIEAVKLLEIVREADIHWSERMELHVARIASDASDGDSCGTDDDSTYDSLLPKPSFSVKVRYNYVGKWPALPYELDD